MEAVLASTISPATQRRAAWRVAILLAICIAYANSFQNQFHFDDFHTIVDNPAIRSLRNIPRFFTDATTFSVLPANRTYRPVVSTLLAIDYALGCVNGRSTPEWQTIRFVSCCESADALREHCGPRNLRISEFWAVDGHPCKFLSTEKHKISGRARESAQSV
jgi:hypothetical protein